MRKHEIPNTKTPRSRNRGGSITITGLEVAKPCQVRSIQPKAGQEDGGGRKLFARSCRGHSLHQKRTASETKQKDKRRKVKKGGTTRIQGRSQTAIAVTFFCRTNLSVLQPPLSAEHSSLLTPHSVSPCLPHSLPSPRTPLRMPYLPGHETWLSRNSERSRRSRSREPITQSLPE
ncbi:hypothetical protein Rcae01_00046 [Novipirellula caenicola]|uniref:Uncharacterized protein n=1 Tax=Novipirellula caenicola TaxID=1536901 RepID=A0ABP9VLP5_9BACT